MESSREETPRPATHVQQQQQQHYSIRSLNPVVVNNPIQQQHYSHPAASVIVQNAAVLGGNGSPSSTLVMNSPPGKLNSTYIIVIIHSLRISSLEIMFCWFYPNLVILSGDEDAAVVS